MVAESVRKGRRRSSVGLGALILCGISCSTVRAFVPVGKVVSPARCSGARSSDETVRYSQTVERTEAVSASAKATGPFGPLPWSSSVSGKGAEALLYMPFVDHQIRHIRAQGGARELPVESHLAYRRSGHHTAHIGSACFETEDFRRIRLTYVDAGKAVQVFNSVWYPRLDCDAPLLGIDLLCFGGGHSMLAVVDYQPLSQSAEYKARYIDHLAPIRERYPGLCETMSDRYYTDKSWFSDQMLFGRLPSEEHVRDLVMPAFQEYLHSYTDMVRRARTEGSRAEEEYVLGRQRDYETFNLVHDPAKKLFESWMDDKSQEGTKWSEEYMRQFLFPLAAAVDM